MDVEPLVQVPRPMMIGGCVGLPLLLYGRVALVVGRLFWQPLEFSLTDRTLLRVATSRVELLFKLIILPILNLVKKFQRMSVHDGQYFRSMAALQFFGST
jgi:hypothetical protein